MSIYVTGDTHGEHGRIDLFDNLLKQGDYVIVCGDWGYLYHDSFHEKIFLDNLEARPYTILFVDGNHENFQALYSYPEEIWNGGRVHRIRDNIFHLCRGQVFCIEDKKFFTFGGAFSIDKEFRVLGSSRWEEELPNIEEYNEGKNNLEVHGWKVDYILTHTLNIESIKILTAVNKHNKIKAITKDEAELNFYLEEIRARTEYKQWFFGHFHIEQEIFYTKQRALWFDMVKLD